MWKKQIRAERAAEQASQAVARAYALQKAAMDRPSSSGNDGGRSPSEEASENEADNRSSTTLVTPSLTSRALMGLEDGVSSNSGSDDDSLVDHKSDDDKLDEINRNGRDEVTRKPAPAS